MKKTQKLGTLLGYATLSVQFSSVELFITVYYLLFIIVYFTLHYATLLCYATLRYFGKVASSKQPSGTYWSDLEACVAFAVGQSVRGGTSVGGKSVPTLAASFPRKSGKSGKRHFNRSPPGPKPFPPPPPYQVGGKRSGPELGDFNRPAKRHNRNNHNNRTRDRLRCFKCGSTEHLADQCKNNK